MNIPDTSRRGSSPLRTLFLPLFLLLTLPACGAGLGAETIFGSGGNGGGGGGTTTQAALKIMTTSLPDGSDGATYGPVSLESEGARGTVVWNVLDGTLPPGVSLTSDGVLLGAPTSTGLFSFMVSATDGQQDATQGLAVAVDAFGAFVKSGLTHGDAWSGAPVEIEALGQAGDVTFEVLSNGSGGVLQQVDAAAGTATWLPGGVAVHGVVDRIRVTDDANGRMDEIQITVGPNPLAQHIARFGTTDVWHVDFDAKTGTHAYATDVHHALARMGLRAPSSTDLVGTPTDRLMEMVARRAVLGHVNRLFLREDDGSAGNDGLGISFPYHEPGAPYIKPATGDWMTGRASGYSAMCLCDTANFGQLGAAILDNAGNPYHENDRPGGALGNLGCFINRITDHVITAYDDHGDLLTQTPVHAGDTDVLKALLYGSTLPPGARADAIAYLVDGFARSVALVVAHEVGHSLGLGHTSPIQSGSVMNHSLAIHESVTYSFLPEDIQRLQAGLPGPGRASAAAFAAKRGGEAPEGRPICICGQ